ncbi:DUF397 domain-containing protein [Lentzea tibetensis]|uniref:DUF397 domain-containing protein n=1 Tax=Lentzea tibetensis TaxID=2591470 RepID=A0A563EZ97_9PSEU|nr:DUF397 domain-containing protein [Lentzea tibetensis]TWP53026.1 DUF397 domain-containing protein [Lentzea tibetensis]
MSRWRKSSRSGATDNSECVEIDFTGPTAVLRDSKNPAETIFFSGSSFRAFVGLACRYGDAAR